MTLTLGPSLKDSGHLRNFGVGTPLVKIRGGVSTLREERSSGHESVLDRILDQFCVGAEVEVFHDSVFMKLHRPC